MKIEFGTLEDHLIRAKAGYRGKWPLHEWLDGHIWVLDIQADLGGDIKTFRSTMWREIYRRNCQGLYQTRVDPAAGTLTIIPHISLSAQTTPATGPTPPQPTDPNSTN